MIQDKAIMVNGCLAKIGMKVNPDTDRIYINGREITNLNKNSQIILLNKPKYVIPSCSDKFSRKTVIDLLPREYKKGYFPIGRLDFLSRGALLITNNGNICYKLSHPKFEHKKIYHVELYGVLKEYDIENWMAGVNLDEKKTSPCEISVLKKDGFNFSLKITLREGRNRQIRKVASFFGYKVIDLQRVSFANISLKNLKEGEWKLVDESKLSNIL